MSTTGIGIEAFRLIDPPPFNPSIRISQAMGWHGGCLYVGGGRGPIRGRAGRLAEHADGAQIARYDPATGTWEIVYSSPADAEGAARDRSIRAFADWDGGVIAAAGSMRGQVRLLRAEHGGAFSDYGPPALGQGDADIAALRDLCVLDGRLYTTPVGMNQGRGWADDNMTERAVVLGTEDPGAGDWHELSDPGFGDPANESINELHVFSGTLWAATLNRASGFQLWRADGLEPGKARWSQVLRDGAFRGPASPVPAALAVFDDALWIGTGVQRQPGSGLDSYGPFGPELIRVRADGTWDLIVGEARPTPEGLKRPLSGQGPGFDNPFVQAFWRLGAHEGALYVGGSDWRFWPSYMGRGGGAREDLSPVMQHWLRTEADAWSGDWGMWSSTDGETWETITLSGLGSDPMQYGLRGLLPSPEGLWAVPAVKSGSGGGGGISVWHARMEAMS